MHSSNVSSFIDQSNMILPFQVRFENILKEPNLFFKCRYIADLIHESFSHNIKEIQNRFVLLVEDIFSVKNQSSFDTSDWKLKSLTREAYPKEFDAICLLLYVDGPLFKLIRHLMSDMNNSYEFPVACLPNPLVQKAMMGSFTSSFYLARMSSPQSSLRLNAFEFYMFHFACYITKENNASNPLSFDAANIDNTNVLYYILLENYLECFIPIQIGASMKSMEIKNPDQTTDAKSSLWKSLSSTTTNFLNLSSTLNKTPGTNEPLSMMTNSLNAANNNNNNNRTMNQDLNYGSYGSEASTMPRSSVFNSKILTFNRFQQQNIPTNFHDGNDMIGSTVYKCETVLAIFSEIWLFDANNDNKHQNIMLLNNFNITIEHIRVVRILIKHLHYFCNSLKNKYGELNSGVGGSHDQTQYNSGGFISGTLNDPLDDIKRNLWSVKYPLHKNLYRFLRMIFDRWPNDSSFRVPLETWLSYIQPWRYVPGKNFQKELIQQNDQYDWKRFVSENLFFYTKLFRQVIIRISKQLDLNSAPNSLLVYRVLKVFAQNNLKDWIKEAEMSMSDLNISTYHNRSQMSPNSSLFSTIRHSMSANLGGVSNKNSLIETEPLDSEYVSIFSPGFRDQIIELLFKISNSIYMVEKSLKDVGQNPDAPTRSSILESISNFFNVANDSSNLNKKNADIEKIKNHLNASIEYISLIFDIPQQSMETILANARKTNAYQSSLDDTGEMLDENNEQQSVYKLIDGVPQLTEYGRNQILKGAIKLQNTPRIIEGNPDTQPVRSFEVALLVKVALFLSTVINRKFGPIFTEYYHKQNIYGAFLRMILSPPVSYTRFEKKGINQKAQIMIENLPPRINLRFIASMDFLFYTCLFAICFKFFHMINHVRTFFILSLITAVVYFICKVTF